MTEKLSAEALYEIYNLRIDEHCTSQKVFSPVDGLGNLEGYQLAACWDFHLVEIISDQGMNRKPLGKLEFAKYSGNFILVPLDVLHSIFEFD